MGLGALSKICHEHGMRLSVDGARLAYALLAKGRVLGFSSRRSLRIVSMGTSGFRLYGGREGSLLWRCPKTDLRWLAGARTFRGVSQLGSLVVPWVPVFFEHSLSGRNTGKRVVFAIVGDNAPNALVH